jgi:CheY-specific phosphatase CheX
MAISPSDIETVVKSIWSSMLGKDLEVSSSETGDSSTLLAAGDPAHVSSCVQITGDWQGAVMVDCLGPTARSVAAAMFGMGLEEVGSDEIRDAVGEIANMAGGNIKPLLGGNCQLSLPTVAEGADFRQLVPGASVLFRVVFDTGGGNMGVCVLKKND